MPGKNDQTVGKSPRMERQKRKSRGREGKHIQLGLKIGTFLEEILEERSKRLEIGRPLSVQKNNRNCIHPQVGSLCP